MPEYCSCGAELPPEALFCHKCGKPQRHIPSVEPEPPVVDVAAGPAVITVRQPLPLNFHNPVAVRIAFIVALATALLSSLPVLNVIVWAAAGFFAVYFYRRRTGDLLSVRAGVRMGWMTGVLSFSLTTIIFTIAMLPQALSGGIGEILRSQFKNATDPNMQEALRMFESGPGLAFLLVMSLVMLFVFITGLSVAGGALGAKMVGQD